MSSRRDWLLQQMGITQYLLRRPHVLRGEAAVRVPESVRLLIIADTPPHQTESLFLDVIRSLMLSPEQILVLTPRQLSMVCEDIIHPCWYLGISPVSDVSCKVAFTTPSLADLNHNADAKRALWQQICHYEHYFFTETCRSATSVAN